MTTLTAEMLAAHWRQHHDRMIRQVRYRLGGRHVDAEDLVDEAYARAWRARDRWTPQPGHQDPLTAWIATITTNLIKDRAKSAHHRRTLSVDAASLVGEDVVGPWLVDEAALAALDAVADRMDAAALVPALLAACGSHGQREAVIAAHMLGQPHAQTALQSGVAVAAIKARVFRGMARMRAAYAELTQGGT